MESILQEEIIETIISFSAYLEMAFPHGYFTYTNLMDRVLLHPLLKDQVNLYESIVWSHLLLITLDSFNWRRPKKGKDQAVGGWGAAGLCCPGTSFPGTESAVPSASGSLAWWQCPACGLELEASAAPCLVVSSILHHLHHCTRLMLPPSHAPLWGRPGKPEILFLILQWRWMLKCQKCPWTKNHGSWLSVAEKLDYEHGWGKCQFLHWRTFK